MKLKLCLISASLLLLALPAWGQIATLPRPADIARNGLSGETQFHPKRATQLIHHGNFWGFKGGVTTFGGAAIFAQNWLVNPGLHTQLQTQVFHISDDTPYSSRYGVSRQYSGNIFLIPIYFGVRKDVLYSQFEGAILPYVEAGAGPVFGLLFPYGYGFFNTFAKTQGGLGMGGYFGGGLSYDMGEKTVGTLNVRYNLTHFPNAFDGRHDFNGLSIAFGISRAIGR